MAQRTSISNDELLNHDNISELGIQAHKPPAQPEYSTFQSRLDTFSRWPANHSQTPESLAAAGFYYCGPNDQVKCFHCDIGLSHWEPTDNPWVEHAKWFPDCGFVILVKRKEFINQSAINETQTMSDINSRNNTEHCFSEADVEHYMGSPCAIVALNCGVQPERVRKAIRTKLRQTGTSYNCPNNLIEAALNEQVNETPFSVPDVESPSNGSSSSSTRYAVDDAAMDRVTRMIINFALSGDNAEQTLLTSANVEGASDEITDEEMMDNEDVLNETNYNNNECGMKKKVMENESHNISEDYIEDNSQNAVRNNAHISLEEENKLLRDARMCKICMDAEVNAVFLPCGHLVSCVICAMGLSQCPICRANVKGIVRTYLS